MHHDEDELLAQTRELIGRGRRLNAERRADVRQAVDEARELIDSELVDEACEVIARGREVDAKRRVDVCRIESEARALLVQVRRTREASSEGVTVAAGQMVDELETWLEAQ